MAEKSDILRQTKRKLALACRIVYMEGLADLNLGHISARVPGDSCKIFIKPRGLGLEEIDVDNLITVDLKGNKIEGTYEPHGETPIHTEIYKNRKDVNCITHLHPPISTAFSSCLNNKLFPLNQDGVVFATGIPNILCPELIVNQEQAKPLVEKLGNHNSIIMLNHGIVTVGKSIEEACMNVIFLEKALKIQLIASLFGEINPISEKISLKMYNEIIESPGRTQNMWEYLVRKLKREGLSID